MKSVVYRWYPHPQNTFKTIPRLMSKRITGYYMIVTLFSEFEELQEMVKDKDAWHVAVHGVSKSWTRPSN